jgi:peptide/nickel transport system permease protein
MVVIGLTGWMGVARFVRAEFLKLKQLDFITALRALGASHRRIIFLHMLPNAMAPVLVSAVFGIAGAILTESSLSFLGFGVQPPTPSWGEILSQSRDYIEFAWWLTVFPGFAIFMSITAYNLVGEGLRDAMDPKLFR